MDTSRKTIDQQTPDGRLRRLTTQGSTNIVLGSSLALGLAGRSRLADGVSERKGDRRRSLCRAAVGHHCDARPALRDNVEPDVELHRPAHGVGDRGLGKHALMQIAQLLFGAIGVEPYRHLNAIEPGIASN